MNSRCSILLVEDNDNDVFFFERAIRALGFDGELIVKWSMEEAWQYLQSSPARIPDIIVSDNMPGRAEGDPDLLEQVRSRPEYQPIPFILFTGGVTPGVAQGAKERGAIVITKPVFSEMSNALRPVLEALPSECRQWLK